MNTEGYLMISNIITGALLVMTCSFTVCRRRSVKCPYCNGVVPKDGLRQHIDHCAVAIAGRMGPSAMAIPMPSVMPIEQPLAVAVPYYGNAKVADI